MYVFIRVKVEYPKEMAYKWVKEKDILIVKEITSTKLKKDMHI